MQVFNGVKFVPLDKVLERPEILGLVEDLGLELQRASRFRESFKVYRQWIDRKTALSFPPLSSVGRPEVPFIKRFSERNHHYKDFRHVYESDYNQTLLSFDW